MTGQKQRPPRPSGQKPAAERGTPSAAPIEFLPPLKPMPRLMIVLGVLLAAWLLALVYMRLHLIEHSPRTTGNAQLPAVLVR